MTSKIIITQLPTRLEDSPLYYDFYGFEDDGLASLQSDIESAFSQIPVSELLNRQALLIEAIRLRSLVTNDDNSNQPAFERIVNRLKSPSQDIASLLWLLRFVKTMASIAESSNFQMLDLFLRPETSGAYFVSKPEKLIEDRYHRSEWLRQRLLEKVRTHLRSRHEIQESDSDDDSQLDNDRDL